MADRIQLKRSDVPGRVPVSADLAVGELAVNTADGKLFVKLADGSVAQVGGGGSVVAIRKSQLLTGIGTWPRPANMIGNTVLVTGSGGGCSGGLVSGVVSAGWSGQFAIEVPVDIGAAESVSYIVGDGGLGPASLNSAPNPGGTTSFGAFLSLLGGSSASLIGGAPGGTTGASTAAVTAQGADSRYALAGRITVAGNARATGAGGLLWKMPPIQLPAWGGVMTGAQGYGAGGGSYYATGAGHQNGQVGCILVEWWEDVTL